MKENRESVVTAESSQSEDPGPLPWRDRSWFSLLWYRLVQLFAISLFSIGGGVRATGRQNIPRSGGALMVANHLSYLDVFVLGIMLQRPLNYVARSTLFIPVLGPFIRSVGGFAIQREGMGAQGLKETLKRVRRGGIVTLFPEGTRSHDGELAPLKAGIAVLASRLRVPIIPVGIAGTFEAWHRGQRLPTPHAIRIHYGAPIQIKELAGLSPAEVTELIRARMLASLSEARTALAQDMQVFV